MSTVELSSCDHGVVAKIKRVIMERDLYPRRWGMGPVATEKKKMKADGKLDKYGRPNEATPKEWSKGYTDFNAPAGEEILAVNGQKNHPTPMKEKTDKVDVLNAPPIPPVEIEDVGMVDASTGAAHDNVKLVKESKKRKHEGETEEDKAERKKRKKESKEKKERKERKKSKGKKEENDSE